MSEQTLYTQIGDDYYPMKKVEWEEDEEAKGWVAMYDNETGELVWGDLDAET